MASYNKNPKRTNNNHQKANYDKTYDKDYVTNSKAAHSATFCPNRGHDDSRAEAKQFAEAYSSIGVIPKLTVLQGRVSNLIRLATSVTEKGTSFAFERASYTFRVEEETVTHDMKKPPLPSYTRVGNPVMVVYNENNQSSCIVDNTVQAPKKTSNVGGLVFAIVALIILSIILGINVSPMIALILGCFAGFLFILAIIIGATAKNPVEKIAKNPRAVSSYGIVIGLKVVDATKTLLSVKLADCTLASASYTSVSGCRVGTIVNAKYLPDHPETCYIEE